MAKKPWKNFLITRPTAKTFTAAVSSQLPKELQFDEKKNKLPTPYGLFTEWAKKNLTDDWSSITISDVGFAIAVESEADANMIKNTFGITGQFKKTQVGDKTIQCNYKDADYAKLAKLLEYDIGI